ncbi:hypothetical protein [Salegentibacter flavus]|nr:hypothetical protein [Salegentibacter flavus]
MERISVVIKSGIGAVGMISAKYPLNSFSGNEIINIKNRRPWKWTYS